jgi:hypothetical protein
MRGFEPHRGYGESSRISVSVISGGCGPTDARAPPGSRKARPVDFGHPLITVLPVMRDRAQEGNTPDPRTAPEAVDSVSNLTLRELYRRAISQ